MTSTSIDRASVVRGRDGPSRSVLMVLAILSAAAGSIHLLLTPEHFEERTVYGLFFLAAASFQGWLARALFAHPSIAVFRAGAWGSLGLIVTWILTRAIAPPLTETGGPEPVTLLGVLATSAELATLLILASVLPASTTHRRRRRWPWATAVGTAFTALLLLASSAVSYVPWVAKDLPYFNNQYAAFSLRSPFIIGMPLPHIWVVGAWSTFALIGLAGVLAGGNVAAALRRVDRSCAARRRGFLAAAPAIFAVSSCCGSSVALFLGVSASVALLRFTPWLLAATVALLASSLILTRNDS